LKWATDFPEQTGNNEESNMKIILSVISAALALGAGYASAQNYPDRPVRVIIGFPPGSGTDVMGRVVIQKVSDFWGQNLVADNRGGAGGSIAGAVAAKAAPDGYTLLINSSAHAANPSMYSKLPYDTLKDFTDISMLAIQANVLIVPNSSAFKSLPDFLKAARAKPRSLNFAFAGVGSGTHLNNIKFSLDSNTQYTDVAYKGSGEAILDVIGGRVDAYFAPISAGIGYIQSGKVRAIAISTAKRSAQLPKVPTIAESGVPGFDYALWFGLWAPGGTPAPVVGKIAKDFTRALQDKATVDRLTTLGNELNIMTPQQFSKFVRQQIQEFAKIVKAAGIKPQ
jgi:tripartite-type tricarboxylate transporter receptor subunit TctC